MSKNYGGLGWDSSSFPILCEKCLGNNPFLRMIKNNFQNECKICKRPFTVFTWKPDNNSRKKKTEICPTCAKLKNVCQTCLFDLQFGLPVAIRDKFLKKKVEIPKEQANLDFFISKATENFENLDLPYDKNEAYDIPNDSIINKKISDDNKNDNKNKIIKRNQNYICTFFLKGECNRGDLCPYRHEIPEIDSEEENEKKNQNIEKNIVARYTGIKDPIAEKILKKYSEKIAPEPPKDENIKTLIINDVIDESIKEKDILSIFRKYGEIKQIKLMINNGHCIFVTFNLRKDCENCAKDLFNKLLINNEKYRLSWAKINDNELFGKEEKKIESDDDEKSENNENIKYKIECPQYDDKINKNIAIKNKEVDNNQVTIINLTSYDDGEIPYYASIDPKNKGAVLKKKRKKYFEDL